MSLPALKRATATAILCGLIGLMLAVAARPAYDADNLEARI